jgi:hypothetical protein
MENAGLPGRVRWPTILPRDRYHSFGRLRQIGTSGEGKSVWRTKYGVNSAAVVALVCVFIFARQNLVALRLRPLRTDPCDGVNAFSFLSILVIGVGSLIRRALPRWRDASSAARQVFVTRSQQAVILAVFLNLAAAGVSLARHSGDWIHVPSRGTVLLALGSIAVPLTAVQLMTAAAWRTLAGSPRFPWQQLALVAVLVVAVLSVCPEWPIYSGSVTAHVLTVACGAMVVLVPMRFLLSEMGTDPDVRIDPWLTRGEWGFVTAAVFPGAIGFWFSSSTEQRMFPRLGLAAMVAAALLLACAFLGQPLGVLRSETRGT